MSKTSEALGIPKTLPFAGQEWTVEPLDLNDLVAAEDELGGIDTSSMRGVRFMLYLILRKADPSLSAEDRKELRYKMTPIEVGRMVKLDKMDEAAAFVKEVFAMSGVKEEPEGGNAPAGES